MRRPVRAAVRTLITAGVLALAWTPAVVSAQTPTPLPITVPGVSSVDVDSASIRYTAFTQGLYEAQWRVSGSSGWTAQSVSGGTFFLQDLEPETTYEIQMRVRPATAASTWSAWAPTTPVTFTTLALLFPYRLTETPEFSLYDPGIYVWPTGDTIYMARYTLDVPVDDGPPPARDILALTVRQPSHSFQVLHLRPLPIFGTGYEGYGAGMLMGRCVCFDPEWIATATAGFSEPQTIVAANSPWDHTVGYNPGRLSAAEPNRNTQQGVPIFLVNGLAIPATQHLTSILERVDTDIGSQMVQDGTLTSQGSDYVESYVPGARYLFPSLFPLTETPVLIRPAGEFEGVAIPLQDGGTPTAPLALGIRGLAELTQMPRDSAPSIMVSIIALGAGIAAFRLTHSTAMVVIAGVLALLAGTVIGWVPIWVTGMIGVVSVLLVAWLLFLRKGGD